MRQYQITNGVSNLKVWASRLGEAELEARKLGLKKFTIKVIK